MRTSSHTLIFSFVIYFSFSLQEFSLISSRREKAFIYVWKSRCWDVGAHQRQSLDKNKKCLKTRNRYFDERQRSDCPNIQHQPSPIKINCNLWLTLADKISVSCINCMTCEDRQKHSLEIKPQTVTVQTLQDALSRIWTTINQFLCVYRSFTFSFVVKSES